MATAELESAAPVSLSPGQGSGGGAAAVKRSCLPAVPAAGGAEPDVGTPARWPLPEPGRAARDPGNPSRSLHPISSTNRHFSSFILQLHSHNWIAWVYSCHQSLLKKIIQRNHKDNKNKITLVYSGGEGGGGVGNVLEEGGGEWG